GGALPTAEREEAVLGFAEAAEPLLPPSLMAAAATPADPLVALVAALPDALRAPLPEDWASRLAKADPPARASVEAAASAAEAAALAQDEAETALREAALREDLDHDAVGVLLETAKAKAGATSRAAGLLAHAVTAAIAVVPASEQAGQTLRPA
ncbi:hypothetical protein, partial [Elioraea rosea]|uniref:hypothetical protein n=1 Tax=Elioraea rosea TaxID=2492390 RepID=UPI00194E2854